MGIAPKNADLTDIQPAEGPLARLWDVQPASLMNR
jgi:hypothetical protein